MKYLLILLLFASCKKDEVCYRCKFGNVNGTTPPDRIVCTDGEEPDLGRVVDENGNEMGYLCTKE